MSTFDDLQTSISGHDRAMKLEGRADALLDVARVFEVIGEATPAWFKFKKWLDGELEDIKLEAVVLSLTVASQ